MELWDLYDKNRIKTGRTHERGTPLAEGDYHVVVHVWIRNSKGEILLTKRHENKTHPNLWECTGGSILVGEDSMEGALREVKEEIGISLLRDNGKLVQSERRNIHNDFCDVWLFDQSFDISETKLQEDEVCDIMWVTRFELENIHKANLLVPTLSYYNNIFDK